MVYAQMFLTLFFLVLFYYTGVFYRRMLETRWREKVDRPSNKALSIDKALGVVGGLILIVFITTLLGGGDGFIPVALMPLLFACTLAYGYFSTKVRRDAELVARNAIKLFTREEMTKVKWYWHLLASAFVAVETPTYKSVKIHIYPLEVSGSIQIGKEEPKEFTYDPSSGAVSRKR